VPSCLTLLVPHHPPSWTQVPGRFPRTSSWLMNSLINLETLIYSLELTYSTRCFEQTEGHVLAITQFYKRQFLAGHSQVELQPPLNNMTLTYISAPRRQQTGAQFKPFQGSGTLGAIHHDNRATSL